MCYNIQYLTKRIEKYAERFGFPIEKVHGAVNSIGEKHQISAFEFPYVPIISIENVFDLQLFKWGLVPEWTKDWQQDMQIRSKTLNARVETIFELPSYKASIEKNRCIIILDGFYEHHHLGGKAYPYHISLRNEQPFAVAGIFSAWNGRDNLGQYIRLNTVAIITTKANETMAQIHNNPKLKEPRMPAILTPENEKLWLDTKFSVSPDILTKVLKPIEDDMLKVKTVRPLSGKNSLGNQALAYSHFYYPVIGLPF